MRKTRFEMDAATFIHANRIEPMTSSRDTAVSVGNVAKPPYEPRRRLSSSAWEDLVGGLARYQLWGRIGWVDVKRRYRRTAIGPFWSALTLAFYVLAVGAVGSGLWKQDIKTYIPYLASGLVTWTAVSMAITEACTMFVMGHALFRNVKFEFSILGYALVWKHSILFLHNLSVYIVAVLILNPFLLGPAILLAIPGFFLVLINMAWIVLLVGLLCLRYRDIQPLIQSSVQIAMLVTPILWTVELLRDTRGDIFVTYNPLYHLINVVRAPLMGEAPALANYMAVGLITLGGWGLTYLTFMRARHRITYWS